MVLPVKVSLAKDNALAHTIDISSNGARLGGIRQQLQLGEVIGLTRGSQRAKFRIVWVQQLGETEFQVGIKGVQVQETFWGVDLSAGDRESNESVDMLMTLLKGDAKR